MEVYFGLNEYTAVPNAVVTTGTFDGVHIGHQTIIDRLSELAQKHKGETVLITFHPHPRMVLHPDDHGLQLLNTQEEKIERLAKAGIDHLVILTFTKDFSRQTSLEYVRNILVNAIGTSKLVIGYNHHFGRNREGSFEHLKEYGPVYGFDVEEIPAQDIDHVNVSSTKIRNALLEGDVETANTYLDYPYQLVGEVIEGHRKGREIGFPTANLQVGESTKLIPGNGVYAVRVALEGQILKGMLNIGVRPTVSDALDRSIEVHLFDFEGDLYDKKLKVWLIQRLRDEKAFSSMEDLKTQLQQDQKKALDLLS
ncbi:MAG: bifunctional riboflavin kinase/FAD synthetase [Salibacteraceae bacterium]